MMRSLFCALILLTCCISTQAQQATPDFTLEIVPHFFKVPGDGNFIQPTGIAVNSKGHVFVFNKGHRKLLEFSTDGDFVRSFGEGLFVDPHGLRIDRDDNIWTTDLEHHTVLKLSPEGRLLMVMGQRNTSGLYDDARKMPLFFKPADVAFGSNGDIYVADGYGNHRVVQLNAAGELIRTWGELGSEEGNFNNPHNIVVIRNRVFVADRYNKRVQVFDREGKFLEAWTNVGIPWGLATSPEGNLYLVDGDAEVIYKLDAQGNILGKHEAGPGGKDGQLRAAHGIAAGPQEELYVTEVLNWRAQKFQQKWTKGPWQRLLTTGCATYRHESAFVEVDGKFYALGGRNTDKVDIFDPLTKTWSEGAPTPLEMHHFQAIAYQDEIWVIGGFTGPYPKEEPMPFLYVYNPANDSWRVGGKQPDGRHRGAAGVSIYNDKFYLLCGNEEGHYTGHTTWFDEFDPSTKEWKSMPDAPHTRDHFQSAIVGNKLYAAGGRNTSAKTQHVMDQTIPEIDVFDFIAGTWTTLPSSANLPTLRAGTTVVVHEGQVILMGGESGTQIPAHSEVEALNTSTGTWSQLHPMLQGRHGTQAVLYQGKIYLAGGSSDRGGGPEMKSIDRWTLKGQ